MHSSYDNTDTDTTKFSHRSLEQLTGYDTLTEHNYLPTQQLEATYKRSELY